jgi:hypothetical protein
MRKVFAVLVGVTAVLANGCGSSTSSPTSPSSGDGFKISGTVTEAPPGFSPLPDVRIEIVAGASLHSVVKTDSAGAYTFGSLPKGNYTFAVTREGYIDATKPVSLTRNMSVDILLYPVPPPGATARCKDKSWSYAMDKNAACMPRNGGVAYFVCPGPLCQGSGSTGG